MNVLDNSVIIKGSKNGITVFLDEEMPFEELLENVSDKFKNASKFFNNATMAISFDGRNLSAEEEKRILNVISDVSELNIVCVLDENNDIKSVYEEAVKKAMNSFNISHQPERQKITDPKTTCMFYKGTLRSGQVFEADGSVVVLGDVNPGGKVVAKGSVIVLGSLKGNIFAGVDGNENAFVVALEMSPMQIKIGDIIARSSDSGVNKISKGKNKSKILEPKIAYVYDQNIYVEDLEQNALDDISLD
ncbi:septum site-determining protein MinC [Lachnospira eligens]|uniref:Probable septum site-determining protein MinC n=1 Tax=Lachnospira eligens (strain ATCC 27750 / DSM 3376 / VPI C15-48 / C15-B4) TaxID=515620 RepID=MINC_LACE2|nr:septum site-determining protein MinC [Lachnospira eligens]C4Z088.1 RecName: Full=Probable septum site-determining protein MinC [[Eubacterium] eligens ATCC 27750]ACR72001.1 septum site-determining protein MinC [[Eubacterium] eligens ATCC 27750]UEA97045.1 septum site-determining protein MinC [Lachnospira eligens]